MRYKTKKRLIYTGKLFKWLGAGLLMIFLMSWVFFIITWIKHLEPEWRTWGMLIFYGLAIMGAIVACYELWEFLQKRFPRSR